MHYTVSKFLVKFIFHQLNRQPKTNPPTQTLAPPSTLAKTNSVSVEEPLILHELFILSNYLSKQFKNGHHRLALNCSSLSLLFSLWGGQHHKPLLSAENPNEYRSGLC
jgi:hypothetical protein